MLSKKILLVLLVIPALLVFKSLIGPGSLAWGDAPHFYPEGIKELVGEPLAWTDRGISFGGVNNFVFLSPLMFLYGVVGQILGNDLTIRLLFYFPSVILAGFGTYFLTKYLKLSKTTQFFAVLTYLLNTYYLLLVDGGQVGVVLAYGLFPFALLHLKKLMDSRSLITFYLSLIFLSLLSIADPRVAVICVAAIVIWSIADCKGRTLVYLIPLVTALVGLNMYWIFPLLKNAVTATTLSGSGSVRWYDPFLLFSPHWPGNLFGVTARPPVYFFGIPFLVFGVLLFNLSKRTLALVFSFLVFAILSLDIPFVDKLPFGFAFRDSTKFFIPLILFGGILIGNTVSNVSERFRERKSAYYLLLATSYIYLLLLIYPALLGKMNFVLSNREINSDFQRIYQNLKIDQSFYRTVWFSEKHPLAYETNNHPVVDGRDLASLSPFASINASEDVFNFLNNEKFVQWFKVLGIKYLILSDNHREISKTSKDQKDWNTIQQLVASSKHLEKVNWGTNIPIYRINESYPRFFAVKQLVGVVGSSLATGYQLPATVYLEDGKWDPRELEGKDPDSVVLFFNGGNKTDLAMSFLQKYFVSGQDASKNEWAVYSNEQYLKYKYELLIRGVKFSDFDYSKGLSFSTKKGEKIEFKFKVPESGDYIFAVRTMRPFNNETILSWKTNNLTLSKGVHTEVIENESDLEIFNVAGLIPKKDFDDAVKLTETFTKHFKTVEAKDLKSSEQYDKVEIEDAGTLKYKFSMPQGDFWIILSENYSNLWKLRQGDEYHNSVPVFSMINGFYAQDSWNNIGIEFKGQENVRWGVYFSVLSVLALAIVFLWTNEKKNC